MKKVLMVVAAGLFISASMMSCSKKCGHCEKSGSTVIAKVCSDDSKTAYDAAKNSCEGATINGTWVTE